MQSYAAKLDEVAVTKQRGSLDGVTIDLRDNVAPAEVVAVGVMIDLGGDGGRKPSLQANKRHFGTANHGQLCQKHVFVLIGAATKHA